MLYLVCRADQLPREFTAKKPAMFRPSLTHYPRVVVARSPQDAIDKAFQPEPYQPGGKRDLLVIELGEIFEFTAMPIPPPPPPPTYTLEFMGKRSSWY